MFQNFENIKVYHSTLGYLKKRAAIAIPGIGILINPKDKENTDLLRHEFGHILQSRKWGFFFFYFKIAIISLRSAAKANRNKKYNHMECWTEWTANKLAYHYFNCPKDWNFKAYPIEAGSNMGKWSISPKETQ
jgi:hypothetical protein